MPFQRVVKLLVELRDDEWRQRREMKQESEPPGSLHPESNPVI